MTLPTMASSLRFHRRRSGLTQREVANIICLVNENQVSRHERAVDQPSFLTALAYEILFQAPLSQLFPGVYETVVINIDTSVGLDAAEAGGESRKRSRGEVHCAQARLALGTSHIQYLRYEHPGKCRTAASGAGPSFEPLWLRCIRWAKATARLGCGRDSFPRHR